MSTKPLLGPLARWLLLSTTFVGGAGLVITGLVLDGRAETESEAEVAALEAKLPKDGAPPPGVRVAGEELPSTPQFAARIREQAQALLDRKIDVAYRGADLGTFTLSELGASVDVEELITRVTGIAHTGAIRTRAHDVDLAQDGAFDFTLPVQLNVEVLADKLSAAKEELDVAPQPARRRVHILAKVDEVIPHQKGSYLDVYAAAEQLVHAARSPLATKVELAPFETTPRATTEAVRAANIGRVISSFETRYGGAPGRNKNIARASSLLDGLVLMPGETVSFNETVGPRSTENGFFPAPEIYKGEIREGIGGGACQVASTLYAASYFGGFEVLERRNHSRPSAYIRTGMDATVSFPVLDLRIKNPFDFPVVVSADADGSVLRFELFGKERRVDVSLATQTKGILKYSRKIEKAALPAGEFRVKQKGRRGLSLKKVKTTKDLLTGTERLEESMDLYPPTQEIFLVGPGTSEADLPPIEPPEGPSASAATSPAAGGGA